jgi:superfamily II DNA/RNA helicase
MAGYLGNPDLVKALDGTTDKETRRAYIADFRSGKIQFLINCAVLTEGFDAPETACIAVVRPTKSRSLYAQMIGRGTRIKEDGGDCLILDFTGNSGRHRLITPLDVLAGKPLDDDILEDALGMCAEGQPSEEALLAAEQRKREREAADAEARRRAQKIKAKVAYSTRNVDPFDFLGVKRDSGGPYASEKQLRFLRNMGVDIEDGAGRFECSKMIERLQRRRTKKMCSYKQARLLARHGLPDDMSFMDARTAIDAIAGLESGPWKCPEWVMERFVKPEGE